MRIIRGLELLIFGILLAGCSTDYTNQKYYSIKVGEEIEVYIRNNSCCGVCKTENSELKFVEHVVERVVENADSECAGCSSYSGIIYRGIKPGTDTLRIHSYSMSDSCDLQSKFAELIIIEVAEE